MNKRVKSKSECKLVQLDITDSFTRWIQSEKMKERKKKVHKFTSTLIEIKDSDSESADDYIDYTSLIGDRKLPFPFLFDNEENKKDVVLSTQKAGSPENGTVTPRELVNIGVYKPESNSQLLLPKANSTPLKKSESSKNSSHVSLQGILDVSKIDTSAPDKSDLVSDAKSKKTIIDHKSTPNNKRINVIEHRIISPNINKVNCSNSSNVSRFKDESTNFHNTSQKGINIGTPSPTKRRVEDDESGSKRAKVDHSNKKRSHLCKKLFDTEKNSEGLPNTTAVKQNLNSSESYGDISRPSCSKTPEKNNVDTNAKHGMENHDEKASKKQWDHDLRDEQRQQHLTKDEEERKMGTGEKSKSKENESVQSIKVNIADNKIIASENRDVQLDHSFKDKGKDLPKTKNKKQTLPSTASQPSCSTSIQNESVNKGARIVSDKESNKEESVEPIKKKQTVGKGKKLVKSGNEGQALGKTDGHPSCSSIGKSKGIETRAKDEAKAEGKKVIKKYVTLIQELFNTLHKTKSINNLLDDDKEALDIFYKMNTNYQYMCINLFMQQRNWCNIFKFCKKINLPFDDFEISRMYEFFKEKGIVDIDYAEDDVSKLLDLLVPNDLLSIRDSFKLPKTLIKKQDIIDALLRECRKQPRLPSCESTSNILMKEIEHKLGRSVILKKSFHDTFYRAYILATFTNRKFSNIKDYLKSMEVPNYPLDKYVVFYCKEEFIRYAKARQYGDELKQVLGENHVESLEICKLIFKELQKTKNDENNYADRYRDAPHLIQFTARAVYVSTLSSAVRALGTIFPENVKDWLEYMIKEVNYSHRIGEWYYHLSWLHMKHLSPIDYTCAAKLIIKVLEERKEDLSEVQLHQLGQRGKTLKATKKYKISQWYHDRIAELVPKPVNIDGIPSRTVDESNKLEKGEANKTIDKSAEYARMYYLKDGYTHDIYHKKGEEGSMIEATFTLFFWGIIYSDEKTVPGAFVSNVQNVPLDMNSKYFYLNRKIAIDKRLEEIETEWSDSYLIEFVKDKYQKYSHLEAYCRVDSFIKDMDMLETFINCVGRVVLAKIYKRFVVNIRDYKSGLPNLLIWNDGNKKSKFVQVKWAKDTLPIEQTLWLNYLRSVGAEVEIYNSISPKRKAKQKSDDKTSMEASFVEAKGKRKAQKVEAKPIKKANTSSTDLKREKSVPKENSDESTSGDSSE